VKEISATMMLRGKKEPVFWLTTTTLSVYHMAVLSR